VAAFIVLVAGFHVAPVRLSAVVFPGIGPPRRPSHDGERTLIVLRRLPDQYENRQRSAGPHWDGGDGRANGLNPHSLVRLPNINKDADWRRVVRARGACVAPPGAFTLGGAAPQASDALGRRKTAGQAPADGDVETPLAPPMCRARSEASHRDSSLLPPGRLITLMRRKQ